MRPANTLCLGGSRRWLIQLSSNQLEVEPRWGIEPTSSKLEKKQGILATKLLDILI